MFWGLVLKTNKRYSQKVTKAFHVSQTTLDVHTLGDSDDGIQVWVKVDDTDHLIANVDRSASHVLLDLTFTEGESIAFYSKGSGTVHLSGCIVPENDFDDFNPNEEESDEEEVELEKPNLSKKQQKELAAKTSNKKAASQEESDEGEDEDDDDDDDSDDFDLYGSDDEKNAEDGE